MRIILASLSALWSVWERYKLAGCTFYICHPLCSVKGKNKICSTPGLRFEWLLIPTEGYNSSLPPSFPHCYSLPLTFLLSLLLGLLLSFHSYNPTPSLLLWIRSAEAPVFVLSFFLLQCLTVFLHLLNFHLATWIQTDSLWSKMSPSFLMRKCCSYVFPFIVSYLDIAAYWSNMVQNEH